MSCEDADALSDALVEAATKPKRVRSDAGEFERHSLSDMIAAEKHVAGKCATNNANRGLLRTKLIPAGPQW